MSLRLFWLVLALLMASSLGLRAQLTVTASNNATQLAQALVGPGVIVSNAVLNCPAGAAGEFTATNTNLGLNSGILLTTGSVNNAPGPNSSGSTGTSNNGPGDSQLSGLAGTSTFDACILEFDVFSIADTLKFQYVFGSDEYPEFVNSINDVFAFFISGPGITGSQNIALIPNTTLPVTINNVNPGTNAQYYVDNTGGSTIEYDGFTVVLEAKKAVQACQTYHLKLAIADAVDFAYDSGVFIKANSLTSSGITLSTSTSAGSNVPGAVEGCVDGIITFSRPQTLAANADTIHFSIGGSAINGVDYTWIPDSIVLGANQTSADLTIDAIGDLLPEGIENVIIYLHDPCLNNVIDSAVINISDSLITTISPGANICPGDTVHMHATGGANYSWTPSGSLTGANTSDPVAQPLVTTTYTVQVSAQGCVKYDSVTINVSTVPQVLAGSDSTICPGGQVQVNASTAGIVGYSWSPYSGVSNTTVSNPVLFPSSTTTYTLTGTDAFGCQSWDSLTITVDKMTNATAGPDDTLCVGDPVQLNASGGVVYSWSPGASLSDSTIANPMANPASTTTYTLQITNAIGCTKTDQVKITVAPKPTISTGPDKSICSGITTQISATGASTYSWSPATGLSNPNTANPIASPNVTTVYTVTGFNNMGCTDVDSVTVTVTQFKFADAGTDTVICPGESVQLQGSGGAYYTWSPDSSLNFAIVANPTATPPSTTTYTLTATDNQGCTDIDSVTVTVNPPPPITNNPSDTTVCVGNSVQLNASGGVSYSWAPVATLSNATISNPVASPASTTQYIVTVADAAGCTNKDTVTVNVAQPPVANAGTDQQICAGDSVMLQASGAGPTGSYSWAPATGLSDPNIANPLASPAGTTVYTVTVTAAVGCEDIDSVTVTVLPPANANAGSNAGMCQGDTVQLSASGGVTYQWSPTTDLSDPTIANPLAFPITTTMYTVTVTNSDGCIAEDQVQVSVFSPPAANAGPDQSICSGDSVQLSGSGVGALQWTASTGGSLPNTAQIWVKPSVTTTYTLTVTDLNGCQASDQVNVNIHPVSPVVAGNDQAICEGDTALLSASGAANYLWSPSNSLSTGIGASVSAFPTITTMYTVSATDANNCPSVDSVMVTVYPRPQITFAGGDTTVCIGDTAVLTASGGQYYTWSPAVSLGSPSSSTTTAFPAAATIYTLVVEDINGCRDTNTIEVDFHPQSYPNAGPKLSDICAGESVQLQASNGINYSWTPAAGLSDSSLSNPVASPSSTTTYNLNLVDVNGCPATDSVTVVVNPDAVVDAGPDLVLVRGEQTTLNATSNATSYMWTPATFLSDPTLLTPFTQPDSTITYYLFVTTDGGCTGFDSVMVTVKDPTNIRHATAFSPNNDGLNDEFLLQGYEYELERMQIFNRWGQLVFETDNSSEGWNGTVGGVAQPVGVYIYVVEAIGNKGETIMMQGNLTLLR